jgi:hypothetical protein
MKHLGHPKKFARVTEAVTATPDPSVRSGIPVKARPPARARACERLPADPLATMRPCAFPQKLLASRTAGNGKRPSRRQGVASVFAEAVAVKVPINEALSR